MQTAVFVDAGYLFAQGSSVIAGSRQPRKSVRLNVQPAMTLLRGEVDHLAAGTRLLRIYWYDGLVRGGQPTAEQTAVARTDFVKLRLGMVNSRGEQKEVDSLIVTDLIELARNRSITDAIILAGDGDLRIGVQIAQTFGVRIHLIGIKPALGTQSPELVAEADTLLEWNERQIRAALSIDAPAPAIPVGTLPLSQDDGIELHDIVGSAIQEAVESIVDISQTAAHIRENRSIPPEIDRPALGRFRQRLGRDLTYRERADFRAALMAAVLSRAGDGPRP